MKVRSSQFITILILIIVGSLVFLAHYSFTDAYISSPDGIAFELRSPADSLYTWKIGNEAPFKYRMLFPKIVLTSWHWVRESPNDNQSFITVYRTWCYIFFLTAIVSFFAYLRALRLPPRQIFAAMAFYILLPAMSFAFAFPVHTREDLLCYTLLNLGLIAIAKEQSVLFLIVAVAGAFCRETLLILPFVYFIRSEDKWAKRLLISAAPVIALLLLRWLAGYQKYDALGLGLKDNLENIFQTCAFLLMSFGVLWLPFVLGLMNKVRPVSKESEIIYGSAWAAFLLIVTSTFFLGRVMEIRLLYLLAPWIIPIVMTDTAARQEKLAGHWRSRAFFLFSAGGLLFLGGIYIWVWRSHPDLYSMMRPYWWVVLFLSTQLCIMSLPLLGAWRTQRVEPDGTK